MALVWLAKGLADSIYDRFTYRPEPISRLGKPAGSFMHEIAHHHPTPQAVAVSRAVESERDFSFLISGE